MRQCLLFWFWALFIIPVDLTSFLIDENTTKHADIQRSFALLTSLLIKLQCATALSKFLLHDHRGSPFARELGELMMHIKILEAAVIDPKVINPFCGHFKSPKDQLAEDLTNSLQIFTGNPWIVTVRSNIIKTPNIGKDVSQATRRKLLHEAFSNGTLEFRAQNNLRRKDRIRMTLIKHARPLLEKMVAADLDKRFGIRIKTFSSIHSLFKTDMPDLGIQLNDIRPFYDFYARFPDYIFIPRGG